MQTILITGGTGLIGTALTELLIRKGYRVVILSRKQRKPRGHISYAVWDVAKQTIDENAIRQADHIVHLAGAGVAEKRWTKDRKREIVASRVNSSKLLVRSLTETPNRVQTVVGASAIGWYGPDRKGHKPFVETDAASNDFLGQTCLQWEQSIQPVAALEKRLVILRTGIVLSRHGGAYPEFIKPLKAGVAAILGSGRQVISWIHVDDMCRMYLSAIENRLLHGVYNACSPEPSTNKQLMLQIARARKQTFIPVHVPAFALKLVLGEMSEEVLKSTTVDSTLIHSTGFRFSHPTLPAAVNALLREG